MNYDLSDITNRDQLQETYAKYSPNEGPSAVVNRVDQIWKFLREIKIGDIVILPLLSRHTNSSNASARILTTLAGFIYQVTGLERKSRSAY